MPFASNETILNGKYRVLSLIDEGGSAYVWQAEEPKFGGRLVAIKELRRDKLAAGDLAEQERRFRQEVQLAAQLQQAKVPHSIHAHTVEELADGTLLLVMEYAEGGAVADLIKANPQGLPVDQAVKIAFQVAEALEGFHNLPGEPVHRDVKPSNVLLMKDGEARLSDFGLAQLSGMSGRSHLSGGQHPGTAMYMSPEQARSPAPLTPAADLYALGCVTFEMLTGKRYMRYRPGTLASSLRPDVPGWLDGILAQVLHEDPYARLGTAKEFADALQAGLAREAEAARQAEQRRQEEAAALYAQATRLLQRRKYRAVLGTMTELRVLNPAYPDREQVEEQARAGLDGSQPPRTGKWARLALLLVASLLVIVAIWTWSRSGPEARPASSTVIAEATMTASSTPVSTPRPATTIPRPGPDVPGELDKTPVVPASTPTPPATRISLTDTPVLSEPLTATNTSNMLIDIVTSTSKPSMPSTATPLLQLTTAPTSSTVRIPATAPTPTLSPIPVIAEDTENLRLRSGPGEDHGLVGIYPRDTALTLLSSDGSGNWLQVETPDRNVGWMMSLCNPDAVYRDVYGDFLFPVRGSVVNKLNKLVIIGTAAGQDFSRYTISMGLDICPEKQDSFGNSAAGCYLKLQTYESTNPVVCDVLYELDSASWPPSTSGFYQVGMSLHVIKPDANYYTTELRPGMSWVPWTQFLVKE